MIPCSYWASTCIAALPSCMTLYEISVRQTRDLPVVSLFPHPASFRFHLTMDTLAFGYILPTTGRIRDFNPLETCAARRTTQKNGKETVVTVFFPFFTIISFFNFTQLLVFHTYKADICIQKIYNSTICFVKKYFAAPTADASFLYEQFFKYETSCSKPLYAITFSPSGII